MRHGNGATESPFEQVAKPEGRQGKEEAQVLVAKEEEEERDVLVELRNIKKRFGSK